MRKYIFIAFILFCFLWLLSCGLTRSVEESISSGPRNAAPVASDVAITGNVVSGSRVTGNYTYSDADNDPEGSSTYIWYRCVTATSNGAVIAGATEISYVVAPVDVGNYLKFEVTPIAINGLIGLAVSSNGYLAN